MSIDRSHSLAVWRLEDRGRPARAGVRALLSDAYVCFRAGCLTGPDHAGARLHGFLAYLMRCTVTGEAYTVFGYGGKQVRDNLHAADLVAAFDAFHRAPRAAAVYNIGGGR